MTLPTQLTFLRFLLTFLVMGLLMVPGWPAKMAALVGFLAAGLTDWLDGWLARRWHQVSPFGALLDPIADKVLVLGVFLSFVQLRLIPAWMVLVILLRELIITGVRLFVASRGVVLAAAQEGKQKAVSQMVTIIVILTVLMVRELFNPASIPAEVSRAMDWTVDACLWVTVLFTVISGVSFFRRHHAVLWDAARR
ncbi:MAG: CDP-diacylglycerol--glycerol-3-phosphate 3-phosphatidyltransferase [Candidatus Omnitrophota bacterium]|nr:CDP-diacylglycerol--glycerol-3-phosphate 3-phosphatidyltransferase [Candidatus Omnitrophota bacterium]